MSYSLFRTVWKNTKIDYEDYLEHMNFLIRNDYYRKDIKEMFSDEEISKLGKYMKEKRALGKTICSKQQQGITEETKARHTGT